MKLSAPIHCLKREAKLRARSQSIPLHAALDIVAAEQGYKAWSLLAAQNSSASAASRLYAGLQPGELVLIGARPGEGKTLLALECLIEAAKSGQSGMIFSLDFTEHQVLQRLTDLSASEALIKHIHIDCSDDICASRINDVMFRSSGPTLVVVDYLQLLDQNRTHPPLADQVAALRKAARETRSTLLLLSQIDRSFEASGRSLPQLGDIRLPNALDLTLFDTTWFLGNGQVVVGTSAHA